MLYSENEVKKKIQAGCGVFYFYGADEAPLRRAAAGVEKALSEEDPQTTVLDGPTPSVEEVVLAAGTISFFGGRRLVYMPLVRPSAYSDKDLQELCDALRDTQNAVFILTTLMEEKYGKEGARERIYATTDKARGALKGLADAEGYEEFVVPDDVGGRYSVLTAVGLLPIAAAGIDITALMAGARQAMEELAVPGLDNPAWQYAAARHALYQSGKKVELLACYEPAFRFFAEWWKQLYGESEGKEGKGLFPASVEFTADLHSMGQYIQEGERLMFETVVKFAPKGEFIIPNDPDNVDGLNFLAGKPLSFVAEQAMRGTILAHVDGGVPNVLLQLPAIDEKCVGWMIYFFEYVCGLSGHLLGVNPFNQPGVEAYKKNMFALLGKPGYEDRRAELEAKLAQ